MNPFEKLFLSLFVLSGCGPSREPLEVIDRVPAHVLTTEEVRERMRRLGADLGVVTEGILVTGRCTEACAPSAPPGCVARIGDDEGSRGMAVVLVDGEALEAGRRYVVRGTIHADDRVPERWILQGIVMAEVRSVP